MPGQFGLETPQEALARATSGFTESFRHAQESGGPGAQLGASLAAIFGPTIKKTLDTRSARKVAAEKLVKETGISQQDARELAKEQVPRDFTDVRKAKQGQLAAKRASKTVADSTAELGATMARVKGMFQLAGEMRAAGNHTEATQLTLSAVKLQNSETERLAGLENLRARTSASVQATAKSIADQARQGSTEIGDLAAQAEVLRAKIDESSDIGEVSSLTRELDAVEGNIAAKNFRAGLTDNDILAMGLGKPTINLLQASLINTGNQLDSLDRIEASFNPLFLQLKGKMAAGLAAGKDFFGVELSAQDKEFLTEFTTFRTTSLDSLNRYIKLITGAQMSEAEADRLRKAFPDPERMGPTQFLAAYGAVTASLRAVAVRAQRALDTGDLSLVPTDMKQGFGAPIEDFIPKPTVVDVVQNTADEFTDVSTADLAAQALAITQQK